MSWGGVKGGGESADAAVRQAASEIGNAPAGAPGEANSLKEARQPRPEVRHRQRTGFDWPRFWPNWTGLAATLTLVAWNAGGVGSLRGSGDVQPPPCIP